MDARWSRPGCISGLQSSDWANDCAQSNCAIPSGRSVQYSKSLRACCTRPSAKRVGGAFPKTPPKTHTLLHLQASQAEPTMWTQQTQSLPVSALPSAKRFVFDEPVLLSDDETDSESERGGDTLSSEDQKLLSAFIRLNWERKMQAHKQHEMARPALQTAPVMIPMPHHCYEPTSEEMWEVEDDEEECPSCNECSVCWRKDMQRFSSENAPLPSAKPQPQDEQPRQADPNDLIFDLEM